MELDRAVVTVWSGSVAIGLMGLVLCLGIVACASDVQKAPPPPTDSQVRGHADRAFEKLKQEEQERAAQPPVPR